VRQLDSRATDPMDETVHTRLKGKKREIGKNNETKRGNCREEITEIACPGELNPKGTDYGEPRKNRKRAWTICKRMLFPEPTKEFERFRRGTARLPKKKKSNRGQKKLRKPIRRLLTKQEQADSVRGIGGQKKKK